MLHMKKLGIVTTWFDRGAAYVSKLYQAALKDHFEVFIYARGGEKSGKGDPNWDFSYVEWGRKKAFDVPTSFDLRHFKRWLERNKIEVVLFNEQVWWPPVILCNELGVKTAAYVDYYKEDTIEFFLCYDLLICNTKRHYSAFSWHPNCVYVPWGTDVDLFIPTKTNNKSSDIVFFHSCGMNPKRKGTDYAIRAFADILLNNLYSVSTKLIIHSQVDLMDYIPELEKTIKDLQEKKALEVITKTVPPPGLYELGDIYVYPTRLEGIGLTVPEALACGLPVIVPDSPPMSEFVENHVNGITVKVERYIARADGYYWPQCLVDVRSLSDAMHYFVTHHHLLDEYKKRARAYAESKLNWFANAESLHEILINIEALSCPERATASKKALKYTEARTSLPAKYPTIFRTYYFAKKLKSYSVRGLAKLLKPFKTIFAALQRRLSW